MSPFSSPPLQPTISYLSVLTSLDYRTFKISTVMALLTLFRFLCYFALVCPLSGFMSDVPIDSDTFPSGCSRPARWGWPLQGYTTLSISDPTILSTAALNFSVHDPPYSPLSGPDSDLGRRIPRLHHRRDHSGGGSHTTLHTSHVSASSPPRSVPIYAISNSSLPPLHRMVRIHRRHDGGFMSTLGGELVGLIVLFVLWIVGAAIATQKWGDLGWCHVFSTCRLLTAIVAFTWMSWIMTFFLTISCLWCIMSDGFTRPAYGRYSDRRNMRQV